MLRRPDPRLRRGGSHGGGARWSPPRRRQRPWPSRRWGACRTGLYLDAIKKAAGLITDRPVFAGVIGPFSLAARLLDVTEVMIDCYEEPDMVHIVLDKVTQFPLRLLPGL